MEASPFLPVKILNISLSNYGFVIFLKNDKEEKVLPICIGAAEVNSISEALSKQKLPRPSSHTLFRNMLVQLGYSMKKIQVTELIEGTYYARIFLEKEGNTIEFDARPSDAISMALRFAAPIFVHEALFESSGVEMPAAAENEKHLSPQESLREQLKQAVKEERFEDAAKLKEKIQQIEMDDLLNN